ncbi:MAG: Hsp70 family protein, partial [Deltaproteobacteria bacterium]|nr:Hsp70 family protein [Deltaproteobacteria bacterium]
MKEKIQTPGHLKQALHDLKAAPDRLRFREVLGIVMGELPRTLETLPLYQISFDIIEKTADPAEKADLLFEFLKGLPFHEPFIHLYLNAAEAAITAADGISGDPHRRRTELVRLANDLPKGGEANVLRTRAWRLAMGMPDRPRFMEPDMRQIAKELPKANDYFFYRRYTLMGIAAQIPKEAAFAELYKEAMEFAISASAYVEEPYYRKYALTFISEQLPRTHDFYPVYKKAIDEAYKASCEIRDPFAQEHAYIEMIRQVPKTHDFYPLLQELIEKALNFFTVKSWMADVEVFDVVDYVLSAEESAMNESKKNRYTREKYAKYLARELDKFGHEITDMRFIGALSPYTHVWIQPKFLREAVKKVIVHLESLRDTYHGMEVERPVFLKEAYLGPSGKAVPKGRPAPAADCLAVDIGATNTVVMRKKGAGPPDFVMMPRISRKYGGAYVIPTILSPEANAIGAEVASTSPIADIKQMMLENNPRGREHMERFCRILNQNIRNAVSAGGWLTQIVGKGLSEAIYITVPVGFTDYKNSVREITEKVFRGIRTEFIEEPLAAAIGYQVVEERDKVIMIVDFGGSTLNVMAVRVNRDSVHVVAKPDHAQVLGGRDIDVWLAGHLAGKIGVDETKLPYSLITKAEEIKIALSAAAETPFEWNGTVVSTVSREELEEVLDKHDFYRFVDRSLAYVVRRAEKVGLRKDQIEAVLLTGGSSQIPSFREKVGDFFPDLRKENLIYDHSPLSAVCMGAALYGTKDVIDRHLCMSYAVRYATKEKDSPYSFTIVLEKGEPLPFEKTFRAAPARKHGPQTSISLELFEVPDSLVARRWVREGGIEFLKQELAETRGADLRALKTVTIPFKEPVIEDIDVTFRINETNHLFVRC